MTYVDTTFDHTMNSALRDPQRWDELVSDSRRLVPAFIWLTRRIEAVDKQLHQRAGEAAALEARLPGAGPMIASEIDSQLQQFADWAARASTFRKVSLRHRQLLSELIHARGQNDIEMLLRVIAALAAGVLRFSTDDIAVTTLINGIDIPISLDNAVLTPRMLGNRFLREVAQ